MIPAKTKYGAHDNELLAIVEIFKNWKQYLERCQHKVFILTNYNNLCQFMKTKTLSSKQVRWVQELSCYHFQINYCQEKANRPIDALSQYLQQSVEEEETLRA